MNQCPDPETLAAWVDEGLHGDERSRVERHAAGCARCQAHLAAMARIASADQAVLEPQPAHRLWRWLVPAAAGVTAVAIWVLVVPTPQPTPSTQSTQPTQSTPPPVASSQPAPPAPPTLSLENRARAADAVAAPELDPRIAEHKDE
ncbi:MAG: anti-sigma factor family protein, partial [Myxococcota bacterium]